MGVRDVTGRVLAGNPDRGVSEGMPYDEHSGSHTTCQAMPCRRNRWRRDNMRVRRALARWENVRANRAGVLLLRRDVDREFGNVEWRKSIPPREPVGGWARDPSILVVDPAGVVVLTTVTPAEFESLIDDPDAGEELLFS